MNIKTILDLLNYVETEEKAYELIYYISSLEEQLQQKENIIKEVREYFQENMGYYSERLESQEYIESLQHRFIKKKKNG